MRRLAVPCLGLTLARSPDCPPCRIAEAAAPVHTDDRVTAVSPATKGTVRGYCASLTGPARLVCATSPMLLACATTARCAWYAVAFLGGRHCTHTHHTHVHPLSHTHAGSKSWHGRNYTSVWPHAGIPLACQQKPHAFAQLLHDGWAE